MPVQGIKPYIFPTFTTSENMASAKCSTIELTGESARGRNRTLRPPRRSKDSATTMLPRLSPVYTATELLGLNFTVQVMGPRRAPTGQNILRQNVCKVPQSGTVKSGPYWICTNVFPKDVLNSRIASEKPTTKAVYKTNRPWWTVLDLHQRPFPEGNALNIRIASDEPTTKVAYGANSP